MYPKLVDCLVRGAEGDFYLHQYQTGDEFVLDSLQAQILHACNGERDIQWLVKEFNQPTEDIVGFLETLRGAELVAISGKPSKMEVPSLTMAPYLREVHIDATGWCNLFGKCKHCYGRQTFQEAISGQLTTEEMARLVEQLGRLNVANCVLSGGEVFMRKDLPELVSCLARQRVHLTGIFTNGTIYREDVILALQEEKVVTRFLVSLDGHTAEVHDFMRGSGNFAKTLDFIRRVSEAGFPVTVNTVVIKQNVRHLVAMARFLESLGTVRLWRISVPREQGETIVNKELIMPEWSDVFEAYEMLVRHAVSSSGEMQYQISSIFKSALLREPVYYLFRPESSCCEYKRGSITIKPNGKVTPCTAFDNFVLGDVRQTPLDEIWYSDLAQSFKILPVEATACKNCELLPYCGGGCRKVAWEIHGSVLAVDDSACPLYRFAKDVVQPILDEHGIRAELLECPKPYSLDPQAIDRAIGG